MKSLKKYTRPIILAVQIVAAVGTVISILCKKNSLASVFAATGLLAAVAMWFLNKKEQSEKKVEEEWDSEKFLGELFDDDSFFDGLDEELEEKADEDIPVSVEAELAKDEDGVTASEDELSQAIKNLEEAGKALEEALDEFDDESDAPTV